MKQKVHSEHTEQESLFWSCAQSRRSGTDYIAKQPKYSSLQTTARWHHVSTSRMCLPRMLKVTYGMSLTNMRSSAVTIRMYLP